MINHVAVIIDGNRRWAKARGLEPWKGHEEGAENVDKLLDWCLELGVKEVSLYTLSLENLKRDSLELKFLFKLFKQWFGKIKQDKRISENKIKIKFIGDLSLVPKDVKELAEEIEEDTRDYDGLKLNFCFAYGGRLELVKAFNRLIQEGKKEINEEDITKSLWLPSFPDLVIRTGDATRLSGFLPWQTTYSELLFLKKMWPDFEREDLVRAIKDFEGRERRFGK